jgi:DUF2889 family protein
MELNAMEDFQREISYRLLKRDDGHVALTATLKDRFHDIEAVVVAEVATLTITDATVEFRRSPAPDCRNVAGRLAGLVGFTIGKGLNRKLMELLGGGEGCGNIRNLLLGLLPLAMNLKACSGILDEREMLDAIHEHLRGTCAGYANPVPQGEGSPHS